jgi:hypothetical protein
MPSTKEREIILVALLVALATAMRLALFNGLLGHDDWTYLFYIRSYLNGQTNELLHVPLGLRYLFWFPIAAIFKLFGASYYGAFLPGFLYGLATVPLTFACARKLGQSVAVAVVACLVLLFNPIDWMVATTIRGDIEMSFYGGALLLLLLNFRQAAGIRRLLLGAAIGCVWGCSTLTKEWGFVFAWGFLAVAIFDALDRRRVPWAYAVIGVGFFAVLALDSVFLHAVTGHWLERIKISLSWYQNVRALGEDLGDRSKDLSYLPSILVGLRNPVTEYNRFMNGYPYYGIYMWLLIGALPLGVWLRGSIRPVAWFVTAILLWIEFGSMSWTGYLPYHKEPRYLAIISVPLAVAIAATGASLWNRGSRLLQAALAALTLSVAVLTIGIVHDENQLYTRGHDFVPALIAWLEAHPQARIWTTFGIQDEIDLHLGYRFADLAHHHAGSPGFGAAMDLAFWRNLRQDGDYVLLNESWDVISDEYPGLQWRHLELVPGVTFRGKTTTALLYRVKAGSSAEKETDYLSDQKPTDVFQEYGSLHYDTNVSGLPIILAGKQYEAGLGTHAKSVVRYRLDGKFSLFSSDIGVDDSTLGGVGSVVFEVRVDNRSVYQSKIMRAGDPPEKIQVNLNGAQVLQLNVTDGGDGIHDDHADWADAKLIKIP